ncbi:K(+)/H(+) antiporter 1 [Exophiala dermatitidis]
MATATVTELLTKTVSATAASSTGTIRATPQGGIFEHVNPTHYDTKNPIILFIIQASIVIILTRIIHFPLAYLRQPRVIAEVITGIILGPSIMGRIPGFTKHIFPTASMPAFSLAANIGLVLFLFLVGLEVDLRFLLRNWRVALSVGAAGMALPFGLGAAIAYGLYHEFREEADMAPISFGIYVLFIGVAMAITAFPVLCRILTSLKLLGTPVGVIVLSAGVGNDVTGWILLALCVALVNSGAGLTALWILLVAFGYTLFLVFAVRPCFIYIIRKSGSLANGPTQSVVALTVLLVLASAFFTGIIGIHPIFGAFMIGLMAPHEGGFAVKLTEKIEDLVSVLFLPLYFALSGLSTNLGLLDTGITWAYVVGVCAVAFFGKIAGGTIASRLNGLVWRESLTIGCLMSCKGLVELIVLNIGLQAKILTTRTFTIFVVMALITTFATTPLTTWLYPPWYQQKLELWKQGKIDWDGNPLPHSGEADENSDADMLVEANVAKRVLVYLRLDGLPSLFTMVSLFAHKPEEVTGPSQPAAAANETQSGEREVMANRQALSSVLTLRRPLQVHAMRLMELTERGSSVMRVAEIEDFASRDPVINAFGSFGRSKDIAVAGQIAVVPEHSFSSTLLTRAQDLRSDLVIIPWSETGSMSEYASIFDDKLEDPLANREFGSMVTEVFKRARRTCHVAVFIDHSILAGAGAARAESPLQERQSPLHLSRTMTGKSTLEHINSTVQFKLPDSGRYRLIVVYQGSNDDLFAVRLGLQFAKNDLVDLQILDARTALDNDDYDEMIDDESPKDAEAGLHGARRHTDQEFQLLRTRIPDAVQPRVSFTDLEPAGHQSVFGLSVRAVLEAIAQPSAAETIVMVGRRTYSHALDRIPSSSGAGKAAAVGGGSRDDEFRGVLGPLATTLVKAMHERQSNAGLLVVQARRDPGANVAGQPAAA